MKSNDTLRKEFERFLIAKGYKQYTDSGNYSTVYDYIKRIDKVCKIENCSWAELAVQIEKICEDYDINGVKCNMGSQSHRAVINALKQFKEFYFDYKNS